MEKRILDFINLLRKSGIRISVSESLDCMSAVNEVTISDRDLCHDSMMSSLVKNRDDIETFNQIFDLFWSSFYESLKHVFADSFMEDVGEVNVAELLEMVRSNDVVKGAELGALAEALLNQEYPRIESLIRDAASQTNIANIENMLQIGFFSRRIAERLDLAGAEKDLHSIAESLRDSGLTDVKVDTFLKAIEGLINSLRQAIRNYAERELQKQNIDYMERMRRKSLIEKNFYNLTQDEIEKMREVVVRLAQRVKNVLSIRKRRLKRGKLDLHTMLRRNAGHGGIPFVKVFKARKKDKPKLLVLCDVSSSVANVSRFMLQFVYSLQECFGKIRTFVFVADCGEVTQVFKQNDLDTSIDVALEGGGVINVYARSNFGAAFHGFWKNHLAGIDRRTTVLVLGDARNNYNDPKVWCLREIHKKAKNVIWLNPESPSAWGFGDSVMDRYIPYIDRSTECRNLRQLAEFVDDLLLE